eukprot:TRINITY_DN8878_c0_g1_i1.p1 TRINITY_DN8878_c0_g1~~TRINITY_DN8878_c0_g1_i1.p1  ORF type:complete len:600 (+),score=95.19 TRINITY_DN8878_c0_g1_i1:110-1909(+)
MADSGISPQGVAQLRQMIHEHLRQQNVYGQVREFLSGFLRANGASNFGEDKVLDALQERGLVEDVIRSLHNGAVSSEGTGQEKRPVTTSSVLNAASSYQIFQPSTLLAPNRRYLHLRILGGKAFLDHLIESEEPTRRGKFILHIHFLNQRYRCRPVECAIEPNFSESFLLELQPKNLAGVAWDAVALLPMKSPIHMVLTKVDPYGACEIVGTSFVEWRKVLRTGGLAVAVEIASPLGSRVPVGVIELRMELLPRLNQQIPESEIVNQLKIERTQETEADRRFFVYAKTWWQDFLQIRPSHSSRPIKIFVQNEHGINRPVCSFIKVLRAGRLLDTPRHAARFVSLIPFGRDDVVGGTRTDVWFSHHTFLCRGRGSVEEHAILLCSLLLGFGLDAFVCLGSNQDGPHAWAMTIGEEGSRVWFWESMTGRRYLHQDQNTGKRCPYVRVACVFNHQRFYANIQHDDSVEYAKFDLHDPNAWKAMSSDIITGVVPNLPTPLLPSDIVPATLEEQIESSLKEIINAYRATIGLSCSWDETLSYLMLPALSGYELERITGISVGQEEFQQAIKLAVPEGHTVKVGEIFALGSLTTLFAKCKSQGDT